MYRIELIKNNIKKTMTFSTQKEFTKMIGILKSKGFTVNILSKGDI